MIVNKLQNVKGADFIAVGFSSANFTILVFKLHILYLHFVINQSLCGLKAVVLQSDDRIKRWAPQKKPAN